MTNRLMISVAAAALIAGTGLANAFAGYEAGVRQSAIRALRSAQEYRMVAYSLLADVA